ncbi:helix-turn-helix domain-containing protein [Methylobacterium oryzihabitans]|uniref:Helix-turn-helix domain-containing protein n=1 Tax=Methylobacterium oryzihabitans TaxID=2499852 RepID=A0A437PHX7_9HYPH|nr:AraC family transcriptional regulator [Methylobacterium oryzihabitans]RVU21892.1 helix-turn-helix domain-containing protein [Methylobacterium oryzihabitans]
MTAVASIPSFYYRPSGQPAGEVFEQWRDLMGPMYEIGPAAPSVRLPSGSTVAYQVGDLIAHRTLFTTQRIRRDRRRTEAGPDHFLIQLWRSGRFTGSIAGQPLTMTTGGVAILDRRNLVDGMLDRTDTLGVVVPRDRLHVPTVEAHGLRLDAARNRLLGARLTSFHRQLPAASRDDIPALAGELIAFLHRLLDRSRAGDALEGRELDGGLLALAKSVVRTYLTRPDLSPDFVAGQMGVSRATLYRLFEREDGVMRFVQGERLHAVRNALADPLETRSLARLAEVFALTSPSQLSRGFRNRYGVSPRAWRTERRAALAGGHESRQLWTWLRETR